MKSQDGSVSSSEISNLKINNDLKAVREEVEEEDKGGRHAIVGVQAAIALKLIKVSNDRLSFGADDILKMT